MIRSHNFDPTKWPHPNGAPFVLGIAPGSAGSGRYAAAAAETTFTAGSAVSLSFLFPLALTPMSIDFTIAVGAMTIDMVFRVVGVDQFGKPRTEDVSIPTGTASGAVVRTRYCYRELVSITCVSKSAAGSTSTVAIGHNSNVANWRMALPFKVLEAAEIPRGIAWTGSAASALAVASVDAAASCVVFTTLLNAVSEVVLQVRLKNRGVRG